MEVTADSKYQSRRYDYEGDDVGVTFTADEHELRVCVYTPLSNVNKRGKKVEIIEYRLYCLQGIRSIISEMRSALKPKMPLARVMNAVRSTMLAAEKRSIMKGEGYPAKAYEPFKRSLKGVDPLIPDPSSCEGVEDRRGKDVFIKFAKPEILIISLKSARDAMKSLEHHYLKVNWSSVKKLSEIADDLAKLKGLDAVMEKLSEHGVRFSVQQYAEPLYASAEGAMKKTVKAATNSEVNRFLKEAGILPGNASLGPIGPNDQWVALHKDKNVTAKRQIIATLLRAGRKDLVNEILASSKTATAKMHGFDMMPDNQAPKGPWKVGEKGGFYHVVNVDTGKSKKIGRVGGPGGMGKGKNFLDEAWKVAKKRNATPSKKMPTKPSKKAKPKPSTAARRVKKKSSASQDIATSATFERLAKYGKTLGTSMSNPQVTYYSYNGSVVANSPVGLRYMGSMKAFREGMANGTYDVQPPASIPLSSECDSIRVEGSEAFANELWSALVTSRGNKGDPAKLEDKSVDLCGRQKDVCKGNLGFKRSNMPQIRSDAMPKFLDWWKSRGTKVKKHKEKVGKLTPSQGEINEAKVKGMIEAHESGKWSPMKDPIMTSGDDYVVDGHHRWAAALLMDPKNVMQTIQIDAPIKQVLKAADSFEGVEKHGL